MIDFHTHILPKMDDGSKTIDESRRMIIESFNQGVEVIVASSHFYPWQEKPEDFIRRREKALDSIGRRFSNIWAGAEVAYYDGIDHSKGIERLKIANTNLLLVEMPMSVWTRRMFEALHSLESRLGIRVVLAHLERYLALQKRTTNIADACNNFLIQISADYFIDRKTQRKAIKWFKHGQVDFIGSDCHNLKSRPPNMSQAYKIIEKKLGMKSVKAFNDKQKQYLKDQLIKVNR